MNPLIHRLTFILPLVWMLVYLIGSFIAWEYNPQKWTDIGRFMMVFVCLAASALTVLVVSELTRHKPNR